MVETKGPTGPPHGPAPSLWPLGFAIGLTVALVGLVIGNWATVAVGGVLLVAFGFIWARDVVTGQGEAPEEAVDEAPESPATTLPLAVPVGGPAVEDDEDAEDAMPRSTFLSVTTLGLGGVITGLVAIPVTVFAVGPPFVGQGHDEIDVGPIDDFPEGQFVITTFLLDPGQGEVSRRTAYIRYNGPTDKGPSFTVLSNRCVHLGCPVQVNGLTLEDQKKSLHVPPDGLPVDLTPTQAASGFGCPCHGGQYDTEGNRTAGPPVRALDRYSFLIRDGRLVLIETYSVGEVSGEGADAVITKYDWV
ncbi:MAG TPA: ubiquinol-cytochrome c reductase iron-sulfur subunit, partial [Gaiellaceae bacterium]|nr:ubiquinol-cytochrome c reductase iron-sulfur subunit [Gaiellaceae bacterium]